MPYSEIVLLLPCHSLDDFPTHHEGRDAEGLLAVWTALWHPRLVAGARDLPRWKSAYEAPAELAGKLICVPRVSEEQLPTGFLARCRSEAACLVRGETDRQAILERVFDPAVYPAEENGEADAVRAAELDAEFIADFFALSFCFLQVQLLTRQMRYSSNLDEIHFRQQVVAAAEALLGGDSETARDRLAHCFDLLAEERSRFYAVDSYLLDVTLLEDSTLGPALERELSSPVPGNFMLSGRVAETLAERHPELAEQLRQGLREKRLGLIGGEYDELPLPLLSNETALAQLRQGLTAYKQHLHAAPATFGRRRFGLTPSLPQILQSLGIGSAWHATLDGGKFPLGMQSKTRWQGFDGTTIDMIARNPLDAAKAETYLSLSGKLGETMDSDHVATLVLAHWPGQGCPWLDDLRRAAKHTVALGRFVTVDHYFDQTDATGYQDKFEADAYCSPYLKQAVEAGDNEPISRHVTYWRDYAANCQRQALQTLSAVVGWAAPTKAPQFEAGAGSNIMVGTAHPTLPDQADKPRERGCLIYNGASFVRRVGIVTKHLEHLPLVERPVYAADWVTTEPGVNRGMAIVVDVPPLGFAWIAGNEQPAPSAQKSAGLFGLFGGKKSDPPLVEENRLRNEFFEATVNPVTGALQSVHDYTSRTNRISQQLAFRFLPPAREAGSAWRDPDETAEYTVMAADSVETITNCHALGEIRARGRLLDKTGTVVARFEQIYRVWRGVRVLELEITLDPVTLPEGDPWHAYYACRFAWGDEAAELVRSVNEIPQTTEVRRMEAPNFVEIVSGELSNTLLTGGLPFHRRAGDRGLDTLLIVEGETARQFKVGIGIDLPYPHREVFQSLTPPVVLEENRRPPQNAPGSWLFHIDAKNVQTTAWEPLLDASGRPLGARVRLMEMTGRAAKATLRGFKPFREARQNDFQGARLRELTVEEGAVAVQLAAHEWIEFEALW